MYTLAELACVRAHIRSRRIGKACIFVLAYHHKSEGAEPTFLVHCIAVCVDNVQSDTQ